MNDAEIIVPGTKESGDYGAITFSVPDCPRILELKANGDIYVKGKLIASDREVFEALKEICSARRKN